MIHGECETNELSPTMAPASGLESFQATSGKVTQGEPGGLLPELRSAAERPEQGSGGLQSAGEESAGQGDVLRTCRRALISTRLWRATRG